MPAQRSERTDAVTGLAVVRAYLLGPFSVARGDQLAGPWERPSARRVLQLVLVSPGRRIRRELAAQILFPHLAPDAAARAISKAIHMARAGLAGLGNDAAALLVSDRGLLRADAPADRLSVDLEAQWDLLHHGLAAAPGPQRDALLCCGGK